MAEVHASAAAAPTPTGSDAAAWRRGVSAERVWRACARAQGSACTTQAQAERTAHAQDAAGSSAAQHAVPEVLLAAHALRQALRARSARQQSPTTRARPAH